LLRSKDRDTRNGRRKQRSIDGSHPGAALDGLSRVSDPPLLRQCSLGQGRQTEEMAG
jgi:hypothetical protein